MARQPPHPSSVSLQQRLQAALEYHQRGELQTAGALYGNLLNEDPFCFDALHLLGMVSSDLGKVDEGIDLIRRALSVDDSKAPVHYSLASAYFKKGDEGAALASVERALGLGPEFVDAWFLRGNLLQRAQRLTESAASYQRAVQLRPAFPEAFNNLAAVQRALRQLPDALQSVDRALALQPAYAKALNNRGLILLDFRQGAAAVDSFRRAVAIDAKFAEAWHNLGLALMQLHRYADARDAFGQLAAIAPKFPHVDGNLLTAKVNSCDWQDLEIPVERIVRALHHGEHAAVPLSLLCVCDSAALQLRCAQLYTNAYYPPAVQRPSFRYVHDRIRVAYLSGDLGEHPVTYLLAGVFERHDLSRFETIALSWGRHNDGAARRRVENAFSRFIDITTVSDAEVVQLMRRLEVDIAVDLTGHTLGQRTGILAHRAAPVQVNFLGLPATMGASYVDYLIADRFLVPGDQRSRYAEQIVWLPDGFQPNDDRRKFPRECPPREAFGLPDRGLVFCSFNRNNKMNPICFDVWMRLLESVPGSVLWLLATHADAENNLRREAVCRGVDAGRLVFAANVPYDDYLARYVHADLVLDTSPFNGGTTVSDALSMGVPVITCAGESFAARMAGSLLTSLGLSELVTTSMEEYEQKARTLAKDPAELRSLRGRLSALRTHHAFFDTARYRHHLESAYRTMWERHAAGLPPAAFEVLPQEA